MQKRFDLRTENGGHGVFVGSLKKVVVEGSCAYKSITRRSLFIHCDDANAVLAMDCSEPRLRETFFYIGGERQSCVMERFDQWALSVTLVLLGEQLTISQITSALNLAGRCIGIGAYRPEKGGWNGRFKVDQYFLDD